MTSENNAQAGNSIYAPAHDATPGAVARKVFVEDPGVLVQLFLSDWRVFGEQPAGLGKLGETALSQSSFNLPTQS